MPLPGPSCRQSSWRPCLPSPLLLALVEPLAVCPESEPLVWVQAWMQVQSLAWRLPGEGPPLGLGSYPPVLERVALAAGQSVQPGQWVEQAGQERAQNHEAGRQGTANT